MNAILKSIADFKSNSARNSSLKFMSFIGIILITGCSKEWLDKKPDQAAVVPTTLNDFQLLMDNADQLTLQVMSLHEIASDGHYVADNIATTLTAFQRNAYSWSREMSYQASDGWTKAYQGVLSCNIVLEGLKKNSTSTNVQQWRNIKGQALLHRAVKFFDLAKTFAPPLSPSTNETYFGLPLRLEPDINIPSKRSTVKQTYDQIINDLKEAASLLPVQPIYKTRPSKPAAFAMLARVYLSIENYESAGKYADSCLQLYSRLLDFTKLSSSAAFPIARFNDEVIFHNALNNHTTLGTRLLIDQELYKSYVANDLRKSIFFKILSDGTIGFKGSYTGGVTNFCGLATDEQYLIRAECFARANRIPEAMQDLNKLLETRWNPNATVPAKPYASITAASQDDALTKILIESRKELIVRGVRWTDLRRLNRDVRYVITLSRKIGNKTYVLEPNSFKYTFPLPDDIIEQTDMKQNEGWEN